MSNEIKVVVSDVNKIITKVNWLSSNDYTSAEKAKVANVPNDTNAELATKAVKLFATNLVTNGDFSNGTTGWETSATGSLAIVDNNLQLTGGVDDTYSSYVRTIIGKYDANDKIYIRIKFKPLDADTFGVVKITEVGGAGSAEWNYPATTINTWQTYTNIVSLVLSFSNAYFLIDQRYGAGNQVGKRMQIDPSVIVINLTSMMGAGNELSKEEIESFLSNFENSWFGGVQDFSTVKTLFLQRKTDNPLYRKIIIFDGDSIANAINDSQDGYAGRIASRNGMTYTNYAQDGATITGGLMAGSNPRRWLSRASSEYRSDAEYVILEGGVNDADLTPIGTISTGFDATLDDTNFTQAVEQMFKNAILKYPNKKIGFILIHKTGSLSQYNNRKLFFDRIVECCKKWGIPYLNLFENCHLNPMLPTIQSVYYSDDTHLTSAGYELITPIIEKWLKTL